jgi:acetyl-CoA carboxylase biotin carboxyl carrier protein
MDLDKIRELLKLVADSGVAEVEIEDEDFRMVVRTNAASQGDGPAVTVVQTRQATTAPAAIPVESPATASAAAPSVGADSVASSNETIVRAPIVGTFYEAPSPDADPFVRVGDVVKSGDVLCIIEAMKLMNEIEAEVSGTVKSILVQNAQPVQYDEPLFVIEP